MSFFCQFSKVLAKIIEPRSERILSISFLQTQNFIDQFMTSESFSTPVFQKHPFKPSKVKYSNLNKQNSFSLAIFLFIILLT